MPDKLLKDGLRTSEKIGGVSEFAELLFLRLIIATCHAGRCPWNPDWIRSHALPNRRRKRLAEIAAGLEELRRAHLVTRYTGPDGTAYLLIPNHGQRLSYRVRSPWPAPPSGPPDAEGQTILALPGAPPEKKPEAPGGGGIPPPLFSSPSTPKPPAPPRESEAAWLARLAAAWPGVDLAAELAHARRKKGPRLERLWFEREWLPRCSEKVEAAPSHPAPAPGPEAPPAPDEVWREAAKLVAHATADPALRERRLEAIHDGQPWAALGPQFRAAIRAELKRRHTRAA